MNSPHAIKVLVVDDSAIVRNILCEILTGRQGIGPVVTAPDASIALQKLYREQPDVITLDLEMPGVNGLTFLRRLMTERPTPVIVISSLGLPQSEAALQALRLGAVEVLPKPGGPYSVGDLQRDLPRKVIAAARARVTREPDNAPPAAPDHAWGFHPDSVIAIGASTGGVQAVEEVLLGLPKHCPPVVIAQHIPAGFSASFARRLNGVCAMDVAEAVDGAPLRPGQAWIAPGNRHLTVWRGPSGYRLRLLDTDPVCFQRPSVDVLFHSVATAARRAAIGVILTGMGEDGANGLLAMKSQGARTIAQDRASSVVFGMPKEAIARGAAESGTPLRLIARAIRSALSRQGAGSRLAVGVQQELPA